eukprot:COSAG01_NODE_24522_length_776_cov_0.813885_1_plen_141_part_10
MRRKRRNSDAQPQLHAALVWELLCRVAMASRLSPGHRRVSCLRWLREWCRTPGVTDARAAKGGATAHAPATVRVAQGGTATFLPLRRCQSRWWCARRPGAPSHPTRDGHVGCSAGHSWVAYSDLAARVTAAAPSSPVLHRC